MAKAKAEPDVARYADMFSAMGTEPRLRIMRLLLAAHPKGMIAGDVSAEFRHTCLDALASSRKAQE